MLVHIYPSFFSAGCGDGSFIFEVLERVKTGCPLSSVLSSLCVNPFIDFVIRLSDEPKCSVARICADDFGSALRSLKVLKTQGSIKYCCCCQVCRAALETFEACLDHDIAACHLTEHLVPSIRARLSVNVLELVNISIAESGNFLGWQLGRQSVVL